MSIFDTDLLGSASGALSKFHYGHHPSVIMWASGPAATEEDDGFFTGLENLGQKALEAVGVGAAEEQLFNSFKFDAMVSEGHDAEATITKFPVSSGFLVSDHIIKHNRVLKLEAAAVNMQNSAMWSASVQGLSVATGAIFDNPIIPILGGAAGAVASAFETTDRIQSTYDLFNSFRASGTKLYVSTILGPYLNCVVTSIKTKHDKNTAEMLYVEVTMEELQTIGNDSLADAAKRVMQSAYDYSEFGKIVQSLGIGVLGGAPLPGLGSFGDSPTKQLSNLKSKLGKLNSPISSVKGRLT